MVEHGRLKGHPSYPYGFEPTFHPERIKHYGGKPKLLFLNDMGDVGGNWNWADVNLPGSGIIPFLIADRMKYFALLNPEHIILLLTKNPAWYGLVEWPENVWCGFTATDNKELRERFGILQKLWDIHGHRADFFHYGRWWISLEPWYDDEPAINAEVWTVIGGQTNPTRLVSDATVDWIESYQGPAPLFVKENAHTDFRHGITTPTRQYPDAFKLKGD
jgi:hypothetical protein